MKYNIEWSCKNCPYHCWQNGLSTLTKAVQFVNNNLCDKEYLEVVKIEGMDDETAMEIYKTFSKLNITESST